MDRIMTMQLFVRAAEAGSFSRAARDLGMTQPTVTKQVAALERRLAARLLNRNTRGLSLTEAGALYYDKCKALLEQFEEADSVVKLRQGEMLGMLHLQFGAEGAHLPEPVRLQRLAAQQAWALNVSEHIALALGNEAGLKLPLAAATKAQFDRMIALGLGGLDKSGVAELTFKDRKG